METPAPIVHIALSVTDLETSVAWYSALWSTPPAFQGTMRAGTEHEHRVAVWQTPNLGLHHFEQREPGAFNPRRPGLDHLAFDCDSVEQLEAWAHHLDRIGADRSEILTEPYGSGLAFRDPDGIALEFFVAHR